MTEELTQVEILTPEGESAEDAIEVQLAALRGVPVDLAVELVFGKLEVPQPAVPPPTAILWGDVDIPLRDGAVELSEYTMRISADVPFDLDNEKVSYTGERPCTVTLSDGSKVTGKGHLTSRSMSIKRDSPASRRFQFSIYEWDWSTGVDSRLLVARVEGLPKIICENVCVENGTDVSSQHFRGEGHCVWHVLKTPSGHAVLIERKGATAQQLRFDLRALEFVLGRDVPLTTLWKIDDSGRVTGGLDLARPGPVTNRNRIPVPWTPVVRECWIAPLFKNVARSIGSDRALEIALAGYMDSLSGHIHSAYLLAQVALEASCRIWHKPASSTLVRSTKDWKTWLKSVSAEIKNLASTPEAGALLLKKMESGAIQGPASEVVASAFAASGIVLEERLREEIVRRNSPAHNYLMFDEWDESVDLEVPQERLNMIQTLLAAMVALRCGYTGALVGWTMDETRHLELANFWPARALPEATLRYIYLPKSVDEPGSWKPSRQRKS